MRRVAIAEERRDPPLERLDAERRRERRQHRKPKLAAELLDGGDQDGTGWADRQDGTLECSVAEVMQDPADLDRLAAGDAKHHEIRCGVHDGVGLRRAFGSNEAELGEGFRQENLVMLLAVHDSGARHNLAASEYGTPDVGNIGVSFHSLHPEPTIKADCDASATIADA
jgi:hypothetical protein